MKQIPLSQGKFAIIDDEDFDTLNKYRWFAHKNKKNYYAVRHEYKNRRKPKTINMHRSIIDIPEGLLIDHINGNSLDNRKANLRCCKSHQNSSNRGKQINNTTGAKGVYLTRNKKRFNAVIQCKGIAIYVGVYNSVVLASRAYDEAAKKHHGEFARLNNL